MDLELTDTTALVTGASRGIGYGVADALLREGCRNLVIVSSDAGSIADAKRRLLVGHPAARVEARAKDLADERAIDELAAEFPDVDILVNNAGAIPHGALTTLADESWKRGWELKVFGYVRLCRAYYARMAERRSGVIVNIIGFAGERPAASYIAGSTGNAALIALTKALGASSPEDNVRVVGVNPGFILTDRLRKRLAARAADTFGDEARWTELTTSYPFGRPGSVGEVADTVAFLASPRAGYISGTIVTVDGGVANRPAGL